MTGEWKRWDRREIGPGDAEHAALLLPGGMCTAVQYEELMAEPALAGVRLIAVTVPGMGGTPPPEDLSIENLARLTAQCAADLRCDVVVGFSTWIATDLSLRGCATQTCRPRWSMAKAVTAGSPKMNGAPLRHVPGYA